jgi:FkbH-like protein
MKLIPNAQLLRRKQRGERLLGDGAQKRPPLAVAVLATFNLASLPPFLADSLSQFKLAASVYLSPFGQWMQDALDPESGLYRSAPQFVVLALAGEDLLQPVFDSPQSYPAQTLQQFCESRVGEVEGALTAILKRLPAATVIVGPIGCVRVPNPHLLSGHSAEGVNRAAQRLSAALSEVCGRLPRTILADWDTVESYLGRARCREDRLWYAARMRFNYQGLAQLADLVARQIAVAVLPPKKVLVLDLDNTLWGGVLGEAGITGLELGVEGIGLAFRQFQREVLTLHGMGVLLALCSKGDEQEALRAIEHHPHMLLRREHFAAIRINWLDKAENVRSLSEELNLGLDTFVFVDDHPVERARIRQALPGVAVLDLPEDASARPNCVADCGLFSRVGLTHEDQQRNAAYAVGKKRERLRATLQTVEEFLASLRQEVRVDRLTDDTLARASQLCLRTNQFNLTSKRYTPTDLKGLADSPSREILTVAVRDRFEDSGIVGLAVLQAAAAVVEIDSLMLSCRVLGRGIEDAVLRSLAKRAGAHGARKLVGLYVPSPKNGLVKDFYSGRGFRETTPGRFEIEASDLACPHGIAPELGEWTRL